MVEELPKKRKNEADNENLEISKKSLMSVSLNKSSYEIESELETPKLTTFRLKLHDLEIKTKDFIDAYFKEYEKPDVSEIKCIKFMEKIYFSNIDVLNLHLYEGDIYRYNLRKITHDRLFNDICKRYENYFINFEKSPSDDIGRFGIFLSKTNKYDNAQKILLHELTFMEEIFGKNHMKTFRNILLLAKNYSNNKKYEQSKKMYEKIIEVNSINNFLDTASAKEIKKSLYKMTERSLEINHTIPM